MATEIASAYIKLIPSTSGIKQALTSELGASGEAAGNAASKSIWSKVGGVAKKLGVAVGAAMGAAVTGAAAGMTALSKEALNLYSSYEQLKGGSELLFGDAYDYIAEKAKNAYSTVQMSQNDYLEQANGFAVGLKTALGGSEQAAAELADKILTAEADVIAATGNSQESVQNAFNGLMRGEYTMLDNLGLGIKATKGGMEEVIEKVNEWNAANGEATSYQIDNIADVQSALVDYIEMQGLSGYAAKEALSTIEGSVASTKAAWENLLTGMADSEADTGQLVDNLVQSLLAVKDNVVPVLRQLLPSLADGLTQLATELTPYVGEVVQLLLPSLVEGATGLVGGLVTALPGIVSALITELPTVLSSLFAIIAEQLPVLITTLISSLAAIMPTLVSSLVNGLIGMLTAFTSPEVRAPMVEAGWDLLQALVTGLVEALPELIAAVPTLITNLVTSIGSELPIIIQAAIEIVLALVEGLITAIPALIAAIPELIVSIVDAFMNYDWGSLGTAIVDGIKNGFTRMWENFKAAVSRMVNSLPAVVKKLLGIASPSKVFASIGGYMAEGMEEGILGGTTGVQRAVRLMAGGATTEAQRLTSGVTASVSAGVPYTPASSAVSSGGSTRTLAQIAAAVETMSGKLERLQVVLDDGTLVGVIAPSMDRALGRRTVAAARGY